MFSLHFGAGAYSALRRHLLRPHSAQEQAAFVLFAYDESWSGALTARNVQLLKAPDFVAQMSDYLEVSAETRARIIKTAHDQNLGVAEFHSHPFDAPAQFSMADDLGLQQTVPHMLWRLRQRPYVAVVVGPRDFDGLVWEADRPVCCLSQIVEDGKEFSATGRSLRRWQ